jgi:hypothetical protein
MVTVASDFLIMLSGKWSSQKFQDEQINEKFGVAFYVRNMPGKALKWGTLVKKLCCEW